MIRDLLYIFCFYIVSAACVLFVLGLFGWIRTHKLEAPEREYMRCYQMVEREIALQIYEDILGRSADSVRFYFECTEDGKTKIRIED